MWNIVTDYVFQLDNYYSLTELLAAKKITIVKLTGAPFCESCALKDFGSRKAWWL